MRWFWYVSLAAQAVLLVRIHRLHILPWFRVYLLADLARSMVLVMARPAPYNAVWVATEPALLALQVLVAVECCRRIRVTYPGIGRLGEIVLWTCGVAAVLGSAVSVLPDLHQVDWTRPMLTATAIGKRALSTVLAALFAGLLWFVRALPARAPRNTLSHARILAAYFGVSAIGYALIYTELLSVRAAGILMLAGVTLCFGSWTAILSRAGEVTPVPGRIVSDAEAMESRAEFLALVKNVRFAVWGK